MREADVPERHPQRPLVLAISSEMPWPLNSGGHLRTFHLLRSIAARFRVHLVVPAGTIDAGATEALANHGIRARTAPTPRGTAAGQVMKAAWWAATGQPYVMYGRHYHRALDAYVRSLAATLQPAIIYLDHLDSFNYRRGSVNSIAAIDLHNVYSVIAERSALEHSGPMRAYLHREARLLHDVERRAARETDVLFAVSEQEAAYYRTLGSTNVHLIANGVDCARYEHLPSGRPEGTLIVYVGSMSWRPNGDAAMFLARTVLPQVRRRHPDARLRIVGRDPAPELRALNGTNGIEITGEVPDVVPHLREAAVLAVALDVGGGTRLKILEALAAGLPVVSTPVGAEGLDLTPGEHLLVAPRSAFADAVDRILTDRSLGAALAVRGRVAVRNAYDWWTIGNSAAEALVAAIRPRERLRESQT